MHQDVRLRRAVSSECNQSGYCEEYCFGTKKGQDLLFLEVLEQQPLFEISRNIRYQRMWIMERTQGPKEPITILNRCR